MKQRKTPIKKEINMNKDKPIEDMIISGFYEDRIPKFSQGLPVNELQEIVTAEEVQNYVSKIEKLLSILKKSIIRYKDYFIVYNPKPIPLRSDDWDWYHDEYDGAPDSGDRRFGTTNSFEDAIDQINELEAELKEIA